MAIKTDVRNNIRVGMHVKKRELYGKNGGETTEVLNSSYKKLVLTGVKFLNRFYPLSGDNTCTFMGKTLKNPCPLKYIPPPKDSALSKLQL